jgi:hypothetical protein
MNGMPSASVISLSAPAVSWRQGLALDDAGAGDQEQGPVDADLEAAQLHQAGLLLPPRPVDRAVGGPILAPPR